MRTPRCMMLAFAAAIAFPWVCGAIDLSGNPRVVTQGRPLAEDPSALPDLGCYELQNRVPGSAVILR